MKASQGILITASIFSLLAAPLTVVGGERNENPGAMPEMLLYEAAEKAAEESYAVIIPSSPEKESEKKDVDGKAEQAKDTAVDATSEEKAPQKTE